MADSRAENDAIWEAGSLLAQRADWERDQIASMADDWDDDPVCEHPAAAVISVVSGDHFCARCNTDWWEDPL